MKLSQTAIAILKNFATINPHFVVDPGNTIKTVNPNKSLFCMVELVDEFPVPFALHDLPAFLKTISLFNDPDFTFGENSVIISDENASQEYFYAERDELIYELGTPELDSAGIKPIEISDDMLKKVIKASSINNVEDIMIFTENGKAFIRSLDKESPKKVFTVEIGPCNGNFKVFFKHGKKADSERLNILPLDYQVAMLPQKVSKWYSEFEDVKVTIFIAMHNDSEVAEVVES